MGIVIESQSSGSAGTHPFPARVGIGEGTGEGTGEGLGEGTGEGLGERTGDGIGEGFGEVAGQASDLGQSGPASRH